MANFERMSERKGSKQKLHDKAVDSVKIPPHSIEAEQSVLGGLMLDNQAWDKIIDKLSEADFYRQDHRIIFKTIAELASRDNPLDVLTLTEALKERNLLKEVGGEIYLFELANNTPSATNIVAYSNIVRERSILRQLIGISHKIADTAFNPEGKNSSELLDHAEQKIFSIAEQQARGTGAKNIKSL